MKPVAVDYPTVTSNEFKLDFLILNYSVGIAWYIDLIFIYVKDPALYPFWDLYFSRLMIQKNIADFQETACLALCLQLPAKWF